ncbi:MAG: glycosyltransferase family 39 protein [Phormidesmis sp.]
MNTFVKNQPQPSPKHSPEYATIQRGTYILIAILALAAVLRLSHINQPYVDVFSWRQTSTAMMADNYYRTNWNIFFPEVSWGGAGPNYQGREFQTVSYLSALLYTVFGQQDWIGRSVAVLFGLWGIFALYQLVRRIWDEERALASAAMMAIMPGSIFIERSFLPDPAMVALMTTSFWLFTAHLQTGRGLYLVAAAIVFVWGGLSKITGLIVGIPMLYALFSILSRRRSLSAQRLLPIGIAITLSLIPIAAYYLWARYLANNYPPYHFAGSGNWVWNKGVGHWLGELYFVPDFAASAYYWLWTVPIIILLLAGIAAPYLRRSFVTRSVDAPWLFHWWLLAVGIYYLIGADELVDNPWNFHIFNPAIAALAGQGMIAMAASISSIAASALQQKLSPELVRKTAAVVSIAIILSTILSFGHVRLKSMYSRNWKQQSYELELLLRQASQPGDLVVTMSSDLGDPNVIYYSRRRGWTFPPASNDIDWSQFPPEEDAIQMFESLRERGADWLAIAQRHNRDFRANYPQVAEYISLFNDFSERKTRIVELSVRSR